MNGNWLRLALVITCLLLSCNSARAVTWFDSNHRPDGACESGPAQAAPAAQIPPEDTPQVMIPASAAPTIEGGDAFDSVGD